MAEKSQKLKEFEAEQVRRAEQLWEQLRQEEAALEAERRAFEEQRSRWEEAWREWDIIGGEAGATGGLGERVLSEVIKERSKTEKKRKGLF